MKIKIIEKYRKWRKERNYNKFEELATLEHFIQWYQNKLLKLYRGMPTTTDLRIEIMTRMTAFLNVTFGDTYTFRVAVKSMEYGFDIQVEAIKKIQKVAFSVAISV